MTALPAATAKDSAVMAALLLELAAADDIVAFRRAVEDDKVSALDAACQWYGPSAAGARLRLELRTPAMVARRIPSAVPACTTTYRPLLAAVSTASRSSASENVGRASPFGPQR